MPVVGAEHDVEVIEAALAELIRLASSRRVHDARMHAIGLTRSTGPSVLRFVGMILTWIAYVIGIVALLWAIFLASAAMS